MDKYKLGTSKTGITKLVRFVTIDPRIPHATSRDVVDVAPLLTWKDSNWHLVAAESYGNVTAKQAQRKLANYFADNSATLRNYVEKHSGVAPLTLSVAADMLDADSSIGTIHVAYTPISARVATLHEVPTEVQAVEYEREAKRTAKRQRQARNYVATKQDISAVAATFVRAARKVVASGATIDGLSMEVDESANPSDVAANVLSAARTIDAETEAIRTQLMAQAEAMLAQARALGRIEATPTSIVRK
jgi:hypothetical protein